MKYEFLFIWNVFPRPNDFVYELKNQFCIGNGAPIETWMGCVKSASSGSEDHDALYAVWALEIESFDTLSNHLRMMSFSTS